MLKGKRILIGVFFIAMGLRIALAIVNRSANDNHIDVINLIVDKKIIPEKNQCWSCYQPKLYYLITSGVIKMFHYGMQYKRIIASQMLNVLFAFFILLLIWKFLEKQSIGRNTRLLIFSFFALNPCLAAINIQNTNDTLGILCGTAALFFADSFFRRFSKSDFTWMTISVIAGCLTKATGLIYFAVIMCFFVLKIIVQNENHKRSLLAKYGFIFILCFFLVVPFAGGYYGNYKKYNSLTLSTWDKDAPPLFFTPTYIFRPGVEDMFHSWFTFRYFDLIRQPYVTNGPDNYPIHRTSLWSQLYGRTMFLHFDQWPKEWQTDSPYIIVVGRILMILGIIPLFIFLRGGFIRLKNFLIGIRKGSRKYLIADVDYLHLMAASAFLLSSVYYSYSFRDFSAMKSIYIFPGMISFLKLFSDGYGAFRNRRIIAVTNAILILICLLFIYDLGFLLTQYLFGHYFVK